VDDDVRPVMAHGPAGEADVVDGEVVDSPRRRRDCMSRNDDSFYDGILALTLKRSEGVRLID